MTVCFCFKKNGGKILGNFRCRNTKACQKAVNKNKFKTSKMWMDVWKLWAENKSLNADIVKYEAKELDECLSRYFADIRKSYGSHYEP